MRIHRFHGGLKLDGRRDTALASPIHGCALPPELIVPLAQRDRVAEPVVAVDAHVLRGQCIGEVRAGGGTRVHAPTSGTVRAIEPRDVATAATAAAPCVVIAPDGDDNWSRLAQIEHWQSARRDVLLARIRDCGVAGFGGAAFPTDIKLAVGVGTLIVNGAECEPGITCDNALLVERAMEVIAGAALLARIAGAARTFIAVEDSMRAARAALDDALRAQPFPGAVLAEVPTRYPQGGERQLIETLTGLEVPAHGLPRDIGVLCQNVATAAAVWRAVAHGEAVTSRLVSVSGAGVARPGVFDVRIGTPIAWLVEQAGGYTPLAARLLVGGPLMGLALAHDDVPVDKACNAVQVLGAGEVRPRAPEVPCIRCGECVRVCPAQLLPQQLFAYLTREDWPRVQEHALDACIECGCCAVVCPSQIPLVAWYHWGKGALRGHVEERANADAARERFEARNARLPRERTAREARRDVATKPAPDGGDPPAKPDTPPITKADVLAAIARSRARREARLRAARDAADKDNP